MKIFILSFTFKRKDFIIICITFTLKLKFIYYELYTISLLINFKALKTYRPF